LAVDVALVKMLEERHAPSTAGAGAEALADERSDGRALALHEATDLAERDVETETDFVVWVHGGG